MYKLKETQSFEQKENKDYIKFYGRRKLEYLQNFYYERYKASIRMLESKRNKYENSFILFFVFLLTECLLMCMLMIKTIYNTLPLKLMMYFAICYVGFFLFINLINFLFFFIDFNFENKARNELSSNCFTIKDSQKYYNHMYNKINELLNDWNNVIEAETWENMLEFEEVEKNSKEIVMDYYHAVKIWRYICAFILSIIFLFFIVKI